MTLKELILAVKEKTLSKEQVEGYRDDLANLSAQMFLEMADLEKAEALFLDSSQEKTAVASQRKWNASEKGQRQIQLKNYIRATDKILGSLKSRLYSMYI